jgi:hypothetical protein
MAVSIVWGRKNLWKTYLVVHEMRDATAFRYAKLLFKFHPLG